MKYYLIAGEPSGDLHGGNLIKGIKKHDPEAEFRFWGGDAMVDASSSDSLVMHYKKTSFFGVSDILLNLRTIFAQLAQCKADVENYKPDVLILIDYPGFNFKMAKFAHLKGINTFYYISPKVWAWKEGRVKRIKKYVDQLFIILPFEKDYFAKKGVEVIYEGNPLVDDLAEKQSVMPSREDFLKTWNLDADKPLIALLSGSRKTEISYNLPLMAKISEHFSAYQFVVAGVPWLDKSLYDKVLVNSNVKYICNDTTALLKYSQAALVTSGTATLETALIGTPQVVCYKTSKLTAFMARMVLKIKYISLVNLIMDKQVVRELIQWDMTEENMISELEAILPAGSKRDKLLTDYEVLNARIGGVGASERFAKKMVDLLIKTK